MAFLRYLVVLALGACSLSSQATPIPKSMRNVSTSIDGRWVVEEWHSNGRKVNSNVAIVWEVSGKDLSIQRGNVAQAASTVSYQLVKPVGEGPNALDYTINYTNGRVITYKGRFALSNETLTFCYSSNVNNPRPTECEPAAGVVHYVFTKEKK